MVKSMEINKVYCGDCLDLMPQLGDGCIDLVFTSPPYYNARPEYSEYESYESYLTFIESVVKECWRVLGDGKFLVINSSPVLIARESRSKQSKRVGIPFDIHGIVVRNGFDFIDDIVWVKPEGVGWATSRGRRFSKDRHPMQYKAVPITEYVMVYRKSTDRLIDWNVKKYSDDVKESSKIEDGYEVTNVWKINPAHSLHHPAVFPEELAERVIKYYSFIGDTVLDPFGGIGTTGMVAKRLGRNYILFDSCKNYVNVALDSLIDLFS